MQSLLHLVLLTFCNLLSRENHLLTLLQNVKLLCNQVKFVISHNQVGKDTLSLCNPYKDPFIEKHELSMIGPAQ